MQGKILTTRLDIEDEHRLREISEMRGQSLTQTIRSALISWMAAVAIASRKEQEVMVREMEEPVTFNRPDPIQPVVGLLQTIGGDDEHTDLAVAERAGGVPDCAENPSDTLPATSATQESEDVGT